MMDEGYSLQESVTLPDGKGFAFTQNAEAMKILGSVGGKPTSWEGFGSKNEMNAFFMGLIDGLCLVRDYDTYEDKDA